MAKRGGKRPNAGRKTPDGVTVSVYRVTLDRLSAETLRGLGKGNLSLGCRLAARLIAEKPD